jgi:hypothetical protein
MLDFYLFKFLISGNYFKENSLEDDDYNIDYKIWVFQAALYLVYSLIVFNG